MNTKIILSLMIIGVVGAVAITGTTALFSDSETAVSNTISTGTIEISVNGEDEWAAKGYVNIQDLKPCYTDYAEYIIKNTGNNPANIFKTITETTQEATASSLFEGTLALANTVVSLADVINYDMSVWVYKNIDDFDNNNPVWWQVIYTDDMKITLADKNGKEVLLGMLPVGWIMKVEQSYHMDCEADNDYQDASMTFDITLKAEQLRNIVVLENKIFPAGEEPTIVYDKTYATVKYDVKEKTFNYDLTVENGGALADGEYTLIAWEENGQNFDWSDRVNAIALANITVGDGTKTVSGSIDLNKDLINAKLWLITGTYNPGELTDAFAWNEKGLFETALMDYYDSLTFQP